ncbi:MAG: hypothetical protein DWP94_13100 [Flavobacterium sp.]|nr:MAG: hypothetical protein DWP94_13100 [Flavobacterium sp.]
MGGENPKREENSVGHLEGSILDPLRASSNWEKKLVSEKWKILSTGKQLPNNTTITLLEVTPDCIANSLNPRTNIKPLRQCPNEFKILSRLWTDWFIDMDVDKKNVTITRTSNNLNGVKSILNELFVN